MDQKLTHPGVTQVEGDHLQDWAHLPQQPGNSSASVLKLTDQWENDTLTYPAKVIFDDVPEVTWKKTIEGIVDHNYTTIFMTTITIYALFGDDIRVLAFEKKDDDVFFGISCACLFFFFLELWLSVISKENYFNSFYFWLDFVATISLLPDIGWIWYPMIGQDEDSTGGDDAEQVANAGKASRAGTRTSRVIRIIRLIRLIRIVKLYKNAQKALAEKEGETTQDTGDLHIPTESRVGKKLSDLTTKRVILLVLGMLLILPLFDYDFYVDPYRSWDFAADSLDAMENQPGYDQVVDAIIDYHTDSNRRRPAIKISRDLGNDETWTWEDEDPDDLRQTEMYFGTSGDFVVIADLREDTRLEAGLNIAKTFFVCIVLAVGALTFNNDAQKLVLYPIERMIDKVGRIAKNPIAAATEEDPPDILKLADDLDEQDFGCWKKCCKKQSKEEASDMYETEVLENTISKIGALLALGFGEAGSAIIGENMAKEGDVNPMIAGNKMIAIFGFCDIRQFTDTTEILQEGVMLFTNEIAHIVHGKVDLYGGAANKNIGDAFLLVFKFAEADIIKDGSSVEINAKSKHVQEVADLSLISFVKIDIKINRAPKMTKYRSHERLCERMKNYSVKMGYGLHVGWAIEGAIGSEYKIDASYLSPNVNMASRLEAATKQYGTPILVSGELHTILSPAVKKRCRHIDTVTVKGSLIPMELYTTDLDYSSLTSGQEIPANIKIDPKIGQRRKALLKRRIESLDMQASNIFDTSRELAKAWQGNGAAFDAAFSEGMKAYIGGDWAVAKERFDSVLDIKPRDGPTVALLEFMGETGFKKPGYWGGFRILTEK